MIVPRPLDPFYYLGDDGVPALGFYPILVGQISEVFVLLHNLGIPDNHLLINAFALLDHIDVGRLRLGYTTSPGAVKELSNSFLIQLLCRDTA